MEEEEKKSSEQEKLRGRKKRGRRDGGGKGNKYIRYSGKIKESVVKYYRQEN